MGAVPAATTGRARVVAAAAAAAAAVTRPPPAVSALTVQSTDDIATVRVPPRPRTPHF